MARAARVPSGREIVSAPREAAVGLPPAATERPRPFKLLLGLGLGLLLALLVAGVWHHSGKAKIFVDAVRDDPHTLAIRGEVLFQGKPVSTGAVHIVVRGARSKGYLGGVVVQTDAQGRFEVGALRIETDNDHKKCLRVTATFSGQAADRATEVSGKEDVYLSFSPPWGMLGWVGAIAVLLLSLLLIYLFTGGLGKHKRRLLFGTMYLMTFTSLAVPIGLTWWISQNSYMKLLMDESPIGLIQGTVPGTTGKQWLFHIGGVRAESSVATLAAPGKKVSADLVPANLAANPLGKETLELSTQAGLTVPFYVVLLAMFGAGINMTLKVPRIQKSYAHEEIEEDEPSLVRGTANQHGKPIASDGPGRKKRKESYTHACGVREELIQNYMYLLSAPFLAIAAYYLLQVVASGVNQPVLVLISFATGLTSDLFVGAIIAFAERTLNTLRRRSGVPIAAADARRGRGGVPSSKLDRARKR